ncbi:MAG: FAA hydrolase family protein [Acidobacteria bacterium]|nr:MAG: FAA hydrolase family protein [Acidobacteriota bacterium]
MRPTHTIFSGKLTEGAEFNPDGARYLAPVSPSKIVCVGLNYRDHALEQGKPLPPEPLLFIKPSTSVIGPGAAIENPMWAGRIDHEAELGIVIGKTAKNVPIGKAHEYILGLTCVNDVTARDLQNKDGQYTRCKGFDTFAPIGPCIAVGLDGKDLEVRGYVNGQMRQNSRTRELIFTIPELVTFITSVMTLLPGDIISTGTPSGIGPIAPGDSVTIHVEGVGALTNPVVARG